jgi:hypothetical protein
LVDICLPCCSDKKSSSLYSRTWFSSNAFMPRLRASFVTKHNSWEAFVCSLWLFTHSDDVWNKLLNVRSVKLDLHTWHLCWWCHSCT